MGRPVDPITTGRALAARGGATTLRLERRAVRRGGVDEGIEREIEGGVVLRVLPLERVIASKRATSRPRDPPSLPALEATLQARTKTD